MVVVLGLVLSRRRVHRVVSSSQRRRSFVDRRFGGIYRLGRLWPATESSAMPCLELFETGGRVVNRLLRDGFLYLDSWNQSA